MKLTRALEAELCKIRSEMAAVKVHITIVQLQRLLKKCRPDQARVPKGNRDGGQFADEGRTRVGSKWNETRREDCEVQ